MNPDPSITLRDLFAAIALINNSTPIITASNPDELQRMIDKHSNHCYKIADSMIKARERK